MTKRFKDIKLALPMMRMRAALRMVSLDRRHLTIYDGHMIRSFKHRGLKALDEARTAKRVPADHVGKIRDILAVLDGSSSPADMDLPGFRLHGLQGRRKGHWAVSVSGNWRVTFRFEDGHAVEVDYVDYH